MIARLTRAKHDFIPPESLLTPAERDQVRGLWKEREAKFDEIVSLISNELGCDKAEAEEEAEQAVVRWWEDVEWGFFKVKEPRSVLQRLLREHYLIGEKMCDLRHEAFKRGKLKEQNL